MKLYLIFLFNIFLVHSTLLDTKYQLVARQKRYLTWKEGINWLQFIVGIGIPTELQDQSITLGTVIKAYYLLPNNSTYYTSPSIIYAKKKRSTTNRWKIYELLESFLEKNGLVSDGKACLLRSICEVAAKPFAENSGILVDILHALLRPSSTKETFNNYINSEYISAELNGKQFNSCDTFYPECNTNILEKFSLYSKQLR